VFPQACNVLRCEVSQMECVVSGVQVPKSEH
jgi:hypothetical protein